MFKKYLLLFLITFLLFQSSISTDETQSEFSDLNKLFGKDFIIEDSEEMLTFKSKKKIRSFVHISSKHDMTTEEMIKEFVEQTYIIRFLFSSVKISEEHYLLLRKLEKEINDEARKTHKGKTGSMSDAFVNYLKPTYYSAHCSIYMFKSTGNWEKIIGEEDNQLINSVLEYFDKKYKKYQTKEEIEFEKKCQIEKIESR